LDQEVGMVVLDPLCSAPGHPNQKKKKSQPNFC
jgi:hypothetical protein